MSQCHPKACVDVKRAHSRAAALAGGNRKLSASSMGGRVSRLSHSVAASSKHAATPSSTAATPPQFLAAQKASAVIDASRRALLDNAEASSAASNPASKSTITEAFSSSMRSAPLQDALGRGGGGRLDAGEGAVTEEQLRGAYALKMVLI